MEAEPGFAVVRVEHSYTVLDSRWMAIRTSHRFELTALRAERFFLRSYTWDNEVGIEKAPMIKTGRNPSGTSSHRLQGPVIVGRGGARLAVVDLGRVFQPGETEVLELDHFFVRTNPDNYGFVGHVAKEDCKEIVLKAVLPARPNLRPRFLCGHTGSDDWAEDDPIEPITDLESRLEFSHRVINPAQGLRYRIQWHQELENI
ncbi:hypothetical protein [Paeniglutamicibacter sulfureus]|uniref:Uncharacterized protein n=1 Tax=Paeniglutamicibacter sulfureus TaxID=43666 RepID=A0ABU2BH07_9MICC|nr:hypothetical protein [Paeniglutamicibacter sulfureus]MDR7357927.1 hypothetical protein [Paeniglutamicibacter sulfureus]